MGDSSLRGNRFASHLHRTWIRLNFVRRTIAILSSVRVATSRRRRRRRLVYTRQFLRPISADELFHFYRLRNWFADERAPTRSTITERREHACWRHAFPLVKHLDTCWHSVRGILLKDGKDRYRARQIALRFSAKRTSKWVVASWWNDHGKTNASGLVSTTITSIGNNSQLGYLGFVKSYVPRSFSKFFTRLEVVRKERDKIYFLFFRVTVLKFTITINLVLRRRLFCLYISFLSWTYTFSSRWKFRNLNNRIFDFHKTLSNFNNYF